MSSDFEDLKEKKKRLRQEAKLEKEKQKVQKQLERINRPLNSVNRFYTTSFAPRDFQIKLNLPPPMIQMPAMSLASLPVMKKSEAQHILD